MRKDPKSVVIKANIIEEKGIFDVIALGAFDKVLTTLVMLVARVMRNYNMDELSDKALNEVCTQFGTTLEKLVKKNQ